jgi:hypothetical protein
VPEDVLWDVDDDPHSLPANAKELRAEMEKEQLVQRLERRLGLEEPEATSGSHAVPGSGEAPGPAAFGGWDGPAGRRGAALQALGGGGRPSSLAPWGCWPSD